MKTDPSAGFRVHPGVLKLRAQKLREQVACCRQPKLRASKLGDIALNPNPSTLKPKPIQSNNSDRSSPCFKAI